MSMAVSGHSCPTCGKELDTETGMKIHHTNVHNESLAKKDSECINCGVEFQYYPSNRKGRFCHDCSDRFAEDWGEKMHQVNNLEENDLTRSVDGARHKTDRVRQIKERCSCKWCGFDKPRALQFHHITDDKVASISTMQDGEYTWRELKKELMKCVLICANCHWVEHLEEY